MKAVIGKVQSVDQQNKSFTVSATARARGKDVTKQFDVGWTAQTNFKSKGKRPASSDPSKIKPGVDVIAHIDTAQAGGLVAGEVWHPPSRGGIFLTSGECKDLGGTVVQDWDCPALYKGAASGLRCVCPGGSRCINQV